MDGENTTIYPDGYIHARSIDSGNHASRDWVKNFAYNFVYDMDKNMRIYGENLYAKHSIEYNELESYFYVFNIWDGDYCYNWSFVENTVEKLGLTLVPVLYKGIFDVVVLKAMEANLREDQEGYVVRTIGGFKKQDWHNHVAKWVRPNHVQTDEHWMNQKIVKNRLRG